MKDNSLRSELRENALESSKEYSNEVIAGKILDVYYESLAKKKSK
jgi:hypothetical protein